MKLWKRLLRKPEPKPVQRVIMPNLKYRETIKAATR